MRDSFALRAMTDNQLAIGVSVMSRLSIIIAVPDRHVEPTAPRRSISGRCVSAEGQTAVDLVVVLSNVPRLRRCES